MTLAALNPDSVAVVTGAAAGIGLAISKRFAACGMTLVCVDNQVDRIAAAENILKEAGAQDVLTSPVDVSDFGALTELEEIVADKFGGTDVLVNNAGIQPGSSILGSMDAWHNILGTNLWGVINGTKAFVPRMLKRGRPGIVINTGSKQGITTPPGDPAYNVAKAGVKSFTEALEHELRNHKDAQIKAHLLIPGFVFTELNRAGRKERPPGAWTPDQTVNFMMQRLEAGDFYILCPDNEVSRELDEKRMIWAVGDIVENRPALSRWHPDYSDAFNDFIKGDLSE